MSMLVVSAVVSGVLYAVTSVSRSSLQLLSARDHAASAFAAMRRSTAHVMGHDFGATSVIWASRLLFRRLQT